MKKQCVAPGCTKIVEISRLALFRKKFYSLTHGGDFHYAVLCPEHKERISSGRFDDDNPDTNPDLNNNRPRKVSSSYPWHK